MNHFRLRNYRGPEVWARVRLAYEAGESGPSVAGRLDVGLANLRKKCRREGWSRRHQAERADRALPGERIALAGQAQDGPIDREAALAACLDHAAAAMSRGEGQKALAALKAAQAFTELSRRLDDPAVEGEADTKRHAALDFVRNHFAVEVEAATLAERMLAETVDGQGRHLDMIYHWRAERLGPEVAARDRAQAQAEGRGKYHWDEDGALIPLDRGWMDPESWEED